MSGKELCRLPVIQAVVEKRLRRRDAASQLQLTERQVQRLMNRFRVSGADGLTHARRGKSGANRLDDSLRLRIMALLREKYSDFGPTLAAEKLLERHCIRISIETLRSWMTADGLWVPHSRRKPRVYQPRYQRDCLGELVQIDGSHHDWFEGRADKCCLLVFIDDATGRLMHLHFCETESAFDYMNATRQYVEKHGKPVACTHITLGLPGTAHQDAILGFDALRVFVPAEAFGELVRELTERVETGTLANAVEALRALYGDL
jgi:transposase InsO family protein